MFHTPSEASSTLMSTARRSARVSRTTAAASNTESQSKSVRKNKSVSLRLNAPKGPAKKWAEVLRPPNENARFMILKWVPVEALTFDEKIAWDEEQRRQKGNVITGKDEKEEESSTAAVDDTCLEASCKTVGHSSPKKDESSKEKRTVETSRSEVEKSNLNEDEYPTKKRRIEVAEGGLTDAQKKD